MPNRFKSYTTPIKDLVVVKRVLIEDLRGYLERMYCFNDLANLFIKKPVVQINHSLTKKFSNRNAFSVPPSSEIKIVSCIKEKYLMLLLI